MHVKRILISGLFLFPAMVSSAQSESGDSLAFVRPAGAPDMMPEPLDSFHTHVAAPLPFMEGRYFQATVTRPEINPLAVNLPSMAYLPGSAVISSWGSGAVFADGGMSHLPGMMGIETGALNFRQQVGAFTLSMFGSATKYGYFRGLSTSYGFGGAISYDINEKFGITLFGSYYSSAGIYQPAMMGYVNVPRFGGYVNWRAGEHWGVKVGVQSYRSIAFGRWEAQPIVMPYYRTSGGDEIGVDLGGILYQVIRSVAAKHGSDWGNRGNPTIDPRPSGVFIRPRE